jgi:hypothetical protein
MFFLEDTEHPDRKPLVAVLANAAASMTSVLFGNDFIKGDVLA